MTGSTPKGTRSLRYLAVFISLLIIPYLINSCKPDSTIVSTSGGGGTGGGGTTLKSTVSGQVINKVNGIPIDSALVHITGSTFNVSILTDAQGKFTTDFNLSGTVTFTIITSKSGLISDTTTITVTPQSTVNVPVISLSPVSTGTPASGDPVSIFLLSQTASTIGVKGSGAPEIANLVFQVVDSSGAAIDLAHSVNVKFQIATSPGGGVVISPTVVQTNNLGQATVNITSGTKAGVVQIIAEIDLPKIILKTTPVSVTINGGLPDLAHFSIIPSVLNFPGFDIFGQQMIVGVSVGDKYSNPVRPKTSVYFSTTGGIIEASTQTDSKGLGTVTLISGNPRPNDPILGPGFATVTATTADENFNQISRSAIVLFSGTPQVSISPAVFTIPNLGSQTFNYSVSDQNGNPLAAGTNIVVKVDGQNVKTLGDINIILPDTQNRTKWTNFSFIVTDTVASADSVPIAVTVNATGPNGSAKATVTGTSH